MVYPKGTGVMDWYDVAQEAMEQLSNVLQATGEVSFSGAEAEAARFLHMEGMLTLLAIDGDTVTVEFLP